MDERRRDDYRFLGWLVPGVLLFILAMVVMPTGGHGVSNKARSRATATNAYNIQLAIERYKDVTGSYPHDTDALLREGYLDSFPRNAYAVGGHGLLEADLKMKDVSLGAVDYAGNFSYQPIIEKGEVVSYALAAFAPGEGEPVRGSGTAAGHVVATFGPMTAEDRAALREEERRWKEKEDREALRDIKADGRT